MSVLLPEHRERPIGAGDDWLRSGRGLYLPPAVLDPHKPTCLGLFAGAGGFDLGMTSAGFHVIAANENDVDAAATYLCNLGRRDTRIVFCTPEDEQRWRRGRRKLERYHAREDTPPLEPGSGWIANQPDVYGCEVFFFGDCHALTGEWILDELGLEVGDLDLVVGGPPCQGFSRANSSYTGAKRAEQRHDERNQLVFEFARLVCELKPKALIMENVPNIVNMVTPEGVAVVDALCLILEEGGMGEYEALRRSLAANAGAGAIIKGAKRPARERGGESNGGLDADELEQLAMELV